MNDYKRTATTSALKIIDNVGVRVGKIGLVGIEDDGTGAVMAGL